jgi:GTP-binding protein EngB required for normal cell division
VQKQAEQLIEWYQTRARCVLERHRPEKIDEFDRDCKRLQAAAAVLGHDLSVCFLGSSGVGKSTLINALVADGETVVPAGGVGPLTAQALIVRYGEQLKLEVVYHGGPGDFPSHSRARL